MISIQRSDVASANAAATADDWSVQLLRTRTTRRGRRAIAIQLCFAKAFNKVGKRSASLRTGTAITGFRWALLRNILCKLPEKPLDHYDSTTDSFVGSSSRSGRAVRATAMTGAANDLPARMARRLIAAQALQVRLQILGIVDVDAPGMTSGRRSDRD
jgi:hypothetical protein